LPLRPDRFWVPPTLLSNGYRWLFPGGESDHSQLPNAKVTNAWSFTSTPPTSSWPGISLSTRPTLTLPFYFYQSSSYILRKNSARI